MMKKVTSKLIAIVLTLAMALGCASTAFADQPDPTKITGTTGSITVKKYESSTEPEKTNPVEGAIFSAYKIIGYSDGKYDVESAYKDDDGNIKKDDDGNIIIDLKKVVGGPNTSYGTTEELEAMIAGLQSYIKNNNIQATASGKTEADGSAILKKVSDPKNPNLDLTKLDLGVYLVQETVVPTSGATGYTISSQAFLVSIPEWNQDVDDGIGAWNYNVTAYPKDEKITVDKKMGEGENKTTSDSYSIGDTIPYTVTATIPNYGYTLGNPNKTVTTELLEKGEYDKYNALKVEFTDILSKGLTLNMNHLAVPDSENPDKILPSDLGIKILDKDNSVIVDLTDDLNEGKSKADGAINDASVTLKEVTGYSKDETTGKETNNGKDFLVTTGLTEDGKTKLTVNISWDLLDQYQGKQIQLTYSARLNEDAFIEIANTNDVKYNFSHDPQQSTGNPRTDITPPDTETYTYQMNLTKLLNKESPDKLSGVDVTEVTFRLYTVTDDEEGNSIRTPLFVKQEIGEDEKPVKDGDCTICTDATAEEKITDDENKTFAITQDIHLQSDGSLNVKGFKAGTYELEETKSVSGYTLLTKPITIEVEEVTDLTTKKVTGTVKAYTKDGTAQGEWLTDEDGNEDGIFRITVNNVKKQFNLPQTGGAGLWMFTIAGGILMAAAIIFFHTLRTKKKKDK